MQRFRESTEQQTRAVRDGERAFAVLALGARYDFSTQEMTAAIASLKSLISSITLPFWFECEAQSMPPPSTIRKKPFRLLSSKLRAPITISARVGTPGMRGLTQGADSLFSPFKAVRPFCSVEYTLGQPNTLFGANPEASFRNSFVSLITCQGSAFPSPSISLTVCKPWRVVKVVCKPLPLRNETQKALSPKYFELFQEPFTGLPSLS